MTETLHQLLVQVPRSSSEGVFNVRAIPQKAGCYVGRDHAGNATLLISTEGDGRVPIRLAGIEARFAVSCKVAEPGVLPREQLFTVVLCLSTDPAVEAYFVSAIDSLLALIGERPSTSNVATSVQGLIELFQKLRNPPSRSIAGIVGELWLIRSARDPSAAVEAWRNDPQDRYDFVAENLRLDAKASMSRGRSHSVSFEQANPPAGTVGVIASVWVEQAAGGMSLGELLATIELRLSNRHHLISRLRELMADSLGETLISAMSWRFDAPLASSSIKIYDASSIPALRPPLPRGVSGVRFVSNCAECRDLDLNELNARLSSNEMALLPR